MSSDKQNIEVPAKPKKKKSKVLRIILLLLVLIIAGGVFFGDNIVKKILGEQLQANGVKHESIDINYLTLTISINGIEYTINDGITKTNLAFDSISLARVNPFSYLSDADFPLLFSYLELKGADITYDVLKPKTVQEALSAHVTFDSHKISGWHQNPKKIVETLSFGTDSQEFLERALTFQIEEISLVNLKTKLNLAKTDEINFDLGKFTTAWDGVKTALLFNEIATNYDTDKSKLPLAPIAFTATNFDIRNIQLPSPQELATLVRASMKPEDKAIQKEAASVSYMPIGKEELKIFMNDSTLSLMSKKMLNLDDFAGALDLPNYNISLDVNSMNFLPELLAFINPTLVTSLNELGIVNGVNSSIFLDATLPKFDKDIELVLDLTLYDLFETRLITDLTMEHALTSGTPENMPELIRVFDIKYSDAGLIPRFNIMTQKKFNMTFNEAQTDMLLVPTLLQFIQPELGQVFRKIILEPGVFELTLTRPMKVQEMIRSPQLIPIKSTYTSSGKNLQEEVEKIQK